MNSKEFRQKYLETVKFLKQDSSNVIVSAGGALLMLGLREKSDDLDLDVPPAIFERYKTSTNVEIFGNVEIVNLDETVSLHKLDPSTTTMVVDDVCIYSIDQLIKQKKALIANPKRKKEKIPQDKADLKALEKMKQSGLPVSFKW
jgi:hypothetical protein